MPGARGSVARLTRIQGSTNNPRKPKKKNLLEQHLGISITTSDIKSTVYEFFIGIVISVVVLFFGTLGYIYFNDNPISINEFFAESKNIIGECNNCNWERINGLEVITKGNKEGPMIIFLHGFPETAYLSWHSQIDFFGDLGYFVVAPDQRGYNQSAKYNHDSDYHLNHLSADIISLIDHFGREKAVVVGHDWGAAVAWHLGQFHADRLEKLVILNVPHPAVMRSKLLSSTTQLSNSWYMFFFQLPWLPEAKLRKNNFEWLTGAFTMSPPGTYSVSTIAKYKEAWAQPDAIEGMLGWYRAALRSSIFNPVKTKRVTDVPTLMIWGDQDRALDASMAQPSIDMCDDGKLVMFRDVSHWVQHEAPDRVNSVISDFLI